MSYRLSLYCRPPRFRRSYGPNFVPGSRRLLQEQSRRRCQAGRRLLFLLQQGHYYELVLGPGIYPEIEFNLFAPASSACAKTLVNFRSHQSVTGR